MRTVKEKLFKHKKQYFIMVEIYETGISAVDDNMMGGFYPGIMSSIFGEPNIGKSVLCMQLAYKWAGEGKKVVYFDTEGMPSMQQVFWGQKFKERFNTDKEPTFITVRNPEKLFNILGRDFSYEVDKESGKIGRIAIIKKNIDRRKKDQSDPNILVRENPDIVIIDSFSFITKASIGSMTSILPARADIEAKLLAIFGEWMDDGGKFLLMTHHISKNPTNPQDVGSIEGGNFVKYSSKVIIHLHHGNKEDRESFGQSYRRIRFVRKPVMSAEDSEYKWFGLQLKQDYGFTEI